MRLRIQQIQQPAVDLELLRLVLQIRVRIRHQNPGRRRLERPGMPVHERRAALRQSFPAPVSLQRFQRLKLHPGQVR